MQLRYQKNLQPSVDGMKKISSICWSDDGQRLAVCGSDRIVNLYNDEAEYKDRFPTKSGEKGYKSYVIRQMEWSSDGTMLCLAQSDNIVFIYKLGKTWGDRKCICNKFKASSSVTCLTWPRSYQGGVIFGLAEGHVKIGLIRSNKTGVLYKTKSYVVSVASPARGKSIISGHLDGSIYMYHIDQKKGKRLLKHSSIPYALAWGEKIVAAGNNSIVTFYDSQGNKLQNFDYSNDPKTKDFTVAKANPSGDTIILGNYNRFYVYTYNRRTKMWEELEIKNIQNYYSVTAACWKNDGSKLVVGNLCGSADLFDVSMKKLRYKGKFELNYVSPSQVIVLNLATQKRTPVKSDQGNEILKINIQEDKFCIANTESTIILSELTTGHMSEIQWQGSGNEKFDFTNPNVCMIQNAGELVIVEYGNNSILGNCRTEFSKPHQISVRMNKTKTKKGKIRTIAYLLDLQTICIEDLNTKRQLGTILHDCQVNNLELNAHANKLLFRDKRKQLLLYDIKTQEKNTLLNYCTYSKWVPKSEVVVAQNRQNLCVWYSIENPDKVTLYNIKGDISTIERTSGKTNVIVNELNNTIAYTLDEPLINFGFAIEARNLEKAMEILHPLEMNPETEANWRTLAQLALNEKNIFVAERCYTAIGDVSKSRYLMKIREFISEQEETSGKEVAQNHFQVRAQLAMLEKNFFVAENLFLDNDEVDKAMDMYQELHKWDESIRIAEKVNHPELQDYKENYYDWLMQTSQEEKAAEIKQHQGNYKEAIELYLTARLPAKAAMVVINYSYNSDGALMNRITTALIKSGLYDKAGEFYERMNQMQKALESYCKGNAYNKAVILAKSSAPQLVIKLEERWGDWLVSQRQTENAINHYRNAACFKKAIEAAISARDWHTAVALVGDQPQDIARPFFNQIGQHYAHIRQHDLAEKYYLKAGLPVSAFQMYISSNKWEKALQVARDNLVDNEIQQLYIKQARIFEEELQYKEAERLFLTVDSVDHAINMYKKAGKWDNLLRLVSKYRQDKKKKVQIGIAKKLQKEGKYRQAEQHLVDAGQWGMAVEMYKSSELWEEAIRVCRSNGSNKESCELAKKWAESLGPEKGLEKLLKMKLIDAAIEYLTEKNKFDEAFKMAEEIARHKIPDVYLKQAFYLEDEQRYRESEDAFIKAGKPAEAINMWEHQQNWIAALQVARMYVPQQVPKILFQQGKSLMKQKEFKKAEVCFIQARKPETAIKMYTQISQLKDALRVAKKHAQHMVSQISALIQDGPTNGIKDIVEQAQMWEEQQKWSKAIDAYLDITKEIETDPEELERYWVQAATLATEHEKPRMKQVLKMVCKRLIDIKRFEAAAILFENIGMYSETVKCYIMEKQFEKAKECVRQIPDPEQHTKLMQLVQKAEKKHQNEQGEFTGDEAGLDVLAQKGDWESCLKEAQMFSPEIMNKYLMKYCIINVKAGKLGDTIAALVKYDPPLVSKNFKMYNALSLRIFARCDTQEIKYFRKFFYRLIQKFEKEQKQNTKVFRTFIRYLECAHLINLKNLLEKQGGAFELVTRINISLLRFSDLLRFDQLYYECGTNCQKQGWDAMAFLWFSRYLDIHDAIEDPESGYQDMQATVFEITDIPSPSTLKLPKKPFLSEEQREKISDWVLKQAPQYDDVLECLEKRTCDKCDATVHLGSCECHKCKTVWDMCVVSGYPCVGDVQTLPNSNKQVVTKYWKMYEQVYANDPWSE